MGGLRRWLFSDSHLGRLRGGKIGVPVADIGGAVVVARLARCGVARRVLCMNVGGLLRGTWHIVRRAAVVSGLMSGSISFSARLRPIRGLCTTAKVEYSLL